MNVQASSAPIERTPSRWSGWVFQCKAWAFRFRRFIVNRVGSERVAQHARDHLLTQMRVLAELEGSLWPQDESDPTMVVGKIQNLRVAAKRMHGLEVPADAVFSFWRQLGRASASRGFVQGRELREGCVIPAIGGGLCQLSNAIYDTAVRAGLEVVERHRHSRVLPGSLAEFDRDATVFWNYLDLRLRAQFAWRLEVELDAERLRVRIRGDRTALSDTYPIALRTRVTDTPDDCASCEEDDCHRHIGPQTLSPHRTWLFSDRWPEFLALQQCENHPEDRIVGLETGNTRSRVFSFAQVHASLRTRWALRRGQPLPKARADGLEVTARAFARMLRPDDLDLVIAQGLLPYLWLDGELAGRRFDVLMSALPMHVIQHRLDIAAALHPDCKTLRDFRAPEEILQAERDALAHAEHWISPHAQVLELAGARGITLPWATVPPFAGRAKSGEGWATILFPASALARKGVLELASALRHLQVHVLAPPGAAESESVWGKVSVEQVASIDEGLARADMVVLPAWVEHRPRILLAAIARGIPVVATAACGLPLTPAWECVPEGDVAALRSAILRVMESRKSSAIG